MAIDQKKKSSEEPKPLTFRNNPEVQKRLDAHKAANAADVAYYQRVVKEAPGRAVDMLLYKDMQRHESEMRLIQKQLPQARAFYEQQTPEAKARIDRELAGASPYYADKVFVNAVLRESGRQMRVQLTNPGGTAQTPPKIAA